MYCFVSISFIHNAMSSDKVILEEVSNDSIRDETLMHGGTKTGSF